jgi:hypothetical protein
MLGIPYFWFWIVEVVIFAGVAIFLLLSDDYVPWWVWFGFVGAFILLSLLGLANFRLRQEDDS